MERAIVKNITCNKSDPLCLYDFTLKTMFNDFQVLSIEGFTYQDTNKDYFYKEEHDEFV
jgi:hypothetical protein